MFDISFVNLINVLLAKFYLFVFVIFFFYCFVTWMLEASFYLAWFCASKNTLTCTIFHQHIAKMKSNKNRSLGSVALVSFYSPHSFWLEFLALISYGSVCNMKNRMWIYIAGNSSKSIKTQTGNVQTRGTHTHSFAVL